MNYADTLKRMVEDAGVRQNALAEALGTSEATVSNLLNGKKRITLPEAEAILAVLRERTGRKRGLTLNDLVSDGKAA
jgi:transcriptional regulator with XRE-family HTH domain